MGVDSSYTMFCGERTIKSTDNTDRTRWSASFYQIQSMPLLFRTADKMTVVTKKNGLSACDPGGSGVPAKCWHAGKIFAVP